MRKFNEEIADLKYLLKKSRGKVRLLKKELKNSQYDLISATHRLRQVGYNDRHLALAKNILDEYQRCFKEIELYARYCHDQSVPCSPGVITGNTISTCEIIGADSAENIALKEMASHFMRHCFDMHAMVATKSPATIESASKDVDKAYENWLLSRKII